MISRGSGQGGYRQVKMKATPLPPPSPNNNSFHSQTIHRKFSSHQAVSCSSQPAEPHHLNAVLSCECLKGSQPPGSRKPSPIRHYSHDNPNCQDKKHTPQNPQTLAHQHNPCADQQPHPPGETPHREDHPPPSPFLNTASLYPLCVQIVYFHSDD
jgi:hypothetical protein